MRRTKAQQKHDKTAGYSLFEMLVVLLILALVSASFGIALKDRNPSLDDVAQEITTRLLQTRQTAIVDGQDERVNFSVAKRQIDFGEAKARLALPETMTMTLLVGRELVRQDEAGLFFFPDGASTGATISLAQADKSVKIRVLWLTGIPQIESR